MKFSAKGEDLLKEIEVLSLQPYNDQLGIKSAPIKAWVKGATIGYGYLIPQSEWNLYKNGITKSQADTLYEKKIQPYVDAVNKALEVVVCQHQFDACVILCYNIGIDGFKSSSVAKMVNGQASSYPSLEKAWKSWNKSQGKVSNGLINRRNAEWKIYTQAIYERW